MATIINTPNPPRDADSGSGAGVVLGVIIALLVIVLFFAFGLPYLNGTSNAPAAPATGGPTYNTYTSPSSGAPTSVSGSSTVNVSLPSASSSRSY